MDGVLTSDRCIYEHIFTDGSSATRARPAGCRFEGQIEEPCP